MATMFVFQVGHGIYADLESVGVSCTGTGETFIRAVVARRIAENAEAASSTNLVRRQIYSSLLIGTKTLVLNQL